jgi:hypothetical protein
MKIKITSENSGLKKGLVYNLDETAANILVGKGFAKKMPADAEVTAVKIRNAEPAKSDPAKSDSIKIKITSAESGLKLGEIFNLDPIAANILIGKGQAVAADPKKGPKLAADKPLGRCNMKELAVIVEKEGVEIGEATTKTDIAAAIEAHRKAAAEKVEIDEYLAGRETCDDTCRFAGDDETCTLPEEFECPTTRTE